MKTIIPENNYDVGDYQSSMPLVVPFVDGLIILLSFFYWGLVTGRPKMGLSSIEPNGGSTSGLQGI